MPGQRAIRLLTLGPPEVRSGDEVVRLPPKLMAVLVYLAVAPERRTTRRDILLATFWPEKDASLARNSLNQAVHQLRVRLGERLVESRGHEELVLGGRLLTDVERFEAHLDAGRTARALALYRGPFLEGFHVRNVPEFERWLDGVRTRLRRQAREAALEAAADAERGGRPGEAGGHLRRALEIVPTDETVARRLIRLLLDADDRAAALRQYRRLALRLETELGIRASKETRELVGETGADASAPDGVARSSPARRLAGELTERAGELREAGRSENAAARELLEQAVRAHPTCATAHARYARAIATWVDLFGGPWEALRSAVVAARRATETDPELPEGHLARAVALECGGRPNDAARSYRSVLRLRPDHREAASRLGRVMQFAGDLAGALEWMQASAPGIEEAPAMYHEAAMARHSLGQHGRGDDLYRRALDARPGDRWAAASRVYFTGVSGHLDRALRQARELVDEEPDGFRGLVALGNVLLTRREVEEGIRVFERCHALHPDSRNAGTLRTVRTCLGFAHLEGGDAARGRELLRVAERETRQALGAGATHGGLRYELATIHAARGERERALTSLENSFRAGWLQHELLALDPALSLLRGNQRFEAVREAMEREVEEQRARVGYYPAG